MAYLVEQHYSSASNAVIPAYWQPELAGQTMPCKYKHEAVELEAEFLAEYNGTTADYELDLMAAAQYEEDASLPPGFDSLEDYNNYYDDFEKGYND